jgi:sulfoxide reductase heme-binding subunit YedZ
LIYASAIAAVVHYWWLVKADVTDPRNYAAIVAVLLGVRVWWAAARRAGAAAAAGQRAGASARTVTDRS